MGTRVSVVLTTFNGATRGYLEEAIGSVLNQTFKDFELILVDDGSVDKTKIICSSYLNDARVKYIYQVNQGLASARNTGIKCSRADFICFLDDDDIWKNEKLEEQIKFFRENKDPKIGMVFTPLEMIDENGICIGLIGDTTQGNIYERIVYEGNIITVPSSVMIKSPVFEKVGIFDETMKGAEDMELWSRIAKEYDVYSLKDSLVKYRVHSNRITNVSWKRESFYEFFFYYKILSKENTFEENRVYFNMFCRQTIKLFSLGKYKEARRPFLMSLAYKIPSPYVWAIYFLTFFPSLSELLKRIRRKITLKIL